MTDAGYVQLGAHRYRRLEQNRNYDDSIAACAADGAYLATIESSDENAMLATLITPAPAAWIGLDDLTEENRFRWVTGAAFDPSVFSGFASSEPNNQGNEDCVSLRPDKTWNDFKCGELQRPGLCECEPGYRPPPMPSCLSASEAGMQIINGRRMIVRTVAAEWAVAQARCESIGATLVVIGDTEENTAIKSFFTGESWLGYSDAAEEGVFRWVTGAISSYTNWDGGPPPVSPAENCVAQRPNGGWSPRPCTEFREYACECDPLPP